MADSLSAVGEFLIRLTPLANALTITAALIALWGIWVTWRSRPHVKIWFICDSADSLSIIIENARGSEPVRELLFAKGLLDGQGILLSWDGSGEWIETLGTRQSVVMELFDREQVHGQGAARPHEHLHSIGRDSGVLVHISWRRPIVRWRREVRLVEWSASARRAGSHPVIHTGREAKRIWKAKAAQLNVYRWGR